MKFNRIGPKFPIEIYFHRLREFPFQFSPSPISSVVFCVGIVHEVAGRLVE